jgi:hypothetical protein
VFKSGGGAGLPHVDGMLARPFIAGSFLGYRYPVHSIPSTEDYQQKENGVPFGRIAVAYGLAIPKPKLEQYVLPLDCPDQTKAPLPVWDYDRDEIYAK